MFKILIYKLENLKSPKNKILNILGFQIFLVFFSKLLFFFHYKFCSSGEVSNQVFKNRFYELDDYLDVDDFNYIQYEINHVFLNKNNYSLKKDGGSEVKQILIGRDDKNFEFSKKFIEILSIIEKDIFFKIYGVELNEKRKKSISIFFEEIFNNGETHDSQNSFHSDTFFDSYQVFLSLSDKRHGYENISFSGIPSSSKLSLTRLFFEYLMSIRFAFDKTKTASWRLNELSKLENFFRNKEYKTYKFKQNSLFICDGFAFHKRDFIEKPSYRLCLRIGTRIHPLAL